MRFIFLFAALSASLLLDVAPIGAQEVGQTDGSTSIMSSRPLNSGTVTSSFSVSVGSQRDGDAADTDSVFVVGNGQSPSSDQLFSPNQFDFLLLNDPTRRPATASVVYNSEDELWFFDGSIGRSISTRTGRVCGSSGSYRVCYSQ